MKKFMTLVLALVMVLAIAVPAMAFTDLEKEDAPYELKVYLVEHEDDEFFGLTGMPPSDRGYAKNEIVAAIAELYVPKAAGKVLNADYSGMEFTGDNVTFKVGDNDDVLASSNLKNLGDFTTPAYDADGVYFDFSADLAANKTYKWLFFAKVTGDDASITAALKADAEDFEVIGDTLTVDDDYTVEIVGTSTSISSYDVYDNTTNPDTLLFTIDVNSKGKTTGLTIYQGNDEYVVTTLRDGIGFIGLKVDGSTGLLDAKDDKIIYREVLEIYEDVFVDVLGFDFEKIGNVVDPDTFLSIVGSDDVSATVEIKPWTAYVTVPDNIVVDPPKTGDAASIVGFVMIVLAAAAVVAVKKVRA
ncbi:MAG TPA: hypothetical protein VN462_09200 [Negativicutes bacterium]|nr:hypothetical protein [Negativicutes bacterium]